MHWIDWLITIVPVLLVLALAVYCRRYVRGVADYLAAGRVAGRYLMCVAGLESALGVTMVVATSEAKYKTGFAMDFWGNLSVPVFMIMGLTGFCFYRFRETKALSMGQFLEMRYSKSFRVFAATVRTLAEMACNAIGPAITANFFIYFLGQKQGNEPDFPAGGGRSPHTQRHKTYVINPTAVCRGRLGSERETANPGAAKWSGSLT